MFWMENLFLWTESFSEVHKNNNNEKEALYWTKVADMYYNTYFVSLEKVHRVLI